MQPRRGDDAHGLCRQTLRARRQDVPSGGGWVCVASARGITVNLGSEVG